MVNEFDGAFRAYCKENGVDDVLAVDHDTRMGLHHGYVHKLTLDVLSTVWHLEASDA